MTDRKRIAATFPRYPEAVAIIVRGEGEPGEVRHGYKVEYPWGDDGRKGLVKYFTDDEEQAQALAQRGEGAYGSKGWIQYQALICHTPGCWSPFEPIEATDAGATEEDLEKMRKKRAALSKLTAEERVILGLA